jgi:hypothetical protein
MKQNRIFSLFIISFFILIGSIFAGGRRALPVPEPEIFHEEIEDFFHAEPEITRAEQIVKALAAAYPRRIERAEFRNNDWAVLLRDTWYYYAEGRLLPEELLGIKDQYSPLPFYHYQGELPPWRDPSPEEAVRFNNSINNRRRALRRSHYFFDDLWRAHDNDESYQRVKSIRFLGKSIMVHYGILEDLSLVEERILALAKIDSQVRSWINNINRIGGWMWRDIADTQARSFHAYGAAIDIIPDTYGGKEAYWLWASERKTDWWNISYNGRYNPPDSIIKAFEAYGFVWGGKWLFFDTIHFEYRPEIFILNGLELDKLR